MLAHSAIPPLGAAEPNARSGSHVRIVQAGGAFFLKDFAGRRFVSKGINTVRFDQDCIQSSKLIPYAEACRRKYGNLDAWRTAAADRLVRWNFNTLGAWSDEAVASAGHVPLFVTPNLDLGMSFAWQHGERDRQQHFPDVFDPKFDTQVGLRAESICGPKSRDSDIIGWFIDNELRWGADWRGSDELLALFLKLPPASPGQQAALDWLQSRYRDISSLNNVWHTSVRSWDVLPELEFISLPSQQDRSNSRHAIFFQDCDSFAGLAAERYFAVTCAAIKSADPYHLVLGCRFAYVAAAAVIQAASRHCDVISFNCYDLDPSTAIDAYARSGKPCLIGEFSFRGADSGLPNTNGAGPVVATQVERAAAFRRYVTDALRNPFVIGYHWFEHADQPSEGRFDGENSNFGTVTITDDVYDELTATMTAVNASAEGIHADLTS